MKKLLLLITALFILASVEGQILRYSNYTAPAEPEEPGEEYSCPTCDADVQAYIDDVVGLDATSVGYINDFVVQLKTNLGISNLSDKFDLFYLFANKTQPLALRNLVERDFDCTNISSTTWTQNQGFTGDGTADYLTTGYNPSTDGTNYTLNSASIGMYLRDGTTPTSNECHIGCGVSDGPTIGFISTPTWYLYLNDATNNAASEPGTYNGAYILTRSTDDVEFYKNTSTVAGFLESASGTIPNLELYILAINGDGSATYFSNNQISIAFVGNNVTWAEWLIIQDAMEDYMDDLGYGVFE